MAMQTAHIRIVFADADHPRPLELQLVRSANGVAPLQEVHVQKQICKTRHRIVYRATEVNGGRSIALKFSRDSGAIAELRAEEEVYANQLVSLQGTVIPICFGLYEGEDDDGSVACLVLEDCGDPPRDELDDLPIVQRLAILRGVQSIHKCGILHKDVRRLNVLLREGQIRIIDFEKVSPHSCGAATATIQKQPDYTPMAEFGCRDLRNLCIDLWIWSSYVRIGQANYYEASFPPQEVIDELVPLHRIYYATREEQDAVLARLKKIKEDLDGGQVSLPDLTMDMAFVGGHPYPSKGFPPQDCIDRLVPSWAYRFNDFEKEQLISILKKVQRLREAGLSEEEIERTAKDDILNIHRSRAISSRYD